MIRFIEEGHKVKVTLQFRGREMAHQDLGRNLLERVADDVKEIVPEFLTLLHGVIDSPDIPLNVSRSYLQSDTNVKKITGYITKKVAEKLNDLF